MRTVLVDGYALGDGSRRRGIGAYLQRILAGLAERPGLTVEVLAAPGAPLPPQVHRIPLPQHPPRWAPIVHDLLLPRRLDRALADVFLSPAQHPPRRSPLPWVQTLHDLTPLVFPDPLLARDRRRWRRIGGRLRDASAVIAVSTFSAEQGIRLLDLDPQRVHVVPHGVDPALFSPGVDLDPGAHPYLLHVAAFGPHKGFREALAVIAAVADAGLPHRLIMVGPQDEWMAAQVRALVAAAPRPELVEVQGYVPDLPALYRGAAALLMTSRCEGFGLPALEAMACGTPVVAFANSSLPEVVGQAGILVPDGDVREMADAVVALLGDTARQEELRARGLERARQFTWERAVTGHLELLEAAAR